MTSILQKLNSFLLSDQKDPWEKKTFWCGSLYDCPRKLYYDRLNLPIQRTIDTAVIRRLNKGSCIHELFQNYFSKMGIVISEEEYVKSNELQVSGKIDNILTLDNEPTIVELKTMDSKDYLHTLPKIEHIWQIHTYMYLKQIYKGKLFYIFLDKKSKDNIELSRTDYNYISDKDIIEIDINYEPNIIELIKTKLFSIIRCLESKTLPEKDMDKCTFCPYISECNLEKNNELPSKDLASVFEDFLNN